MENTQHDQKWNFLMTVYILRKPNIATLNIQLHLKQYAFFIIPANVLNTLLIAEILEILNIL